MVIYDKEYRDRTLDAVLKMKKVVGSTLGPNGSFVLISKQEGNYGTKDGVTVAKEMLPSNAYEGAVFPIISQPALQVNAKAGDGTTSATIVAGELVRLGFGLIDDGENPYNICRGMKDAAAHVAGKITGIARQVSTLAEKTAVATLSANGDKEIGESIAKVIHELGVNAVMDIGRSTGSGISIEQFSGMLAAGFGTPYPEFLNHGHYGEFSDMDVVVVAGRVQDFSDATRFINNRFSQNGNQRPVVFVFQRTVKPDALKDFVHTYSKGVPVIAIEPVASMDEFTREQWIRNIAVYCGTKPVTGGNGIAWKDIIANQSLAGHVKNLKINGQLASFIAGAGKQEDIDARYSYLLSQEDHTGMYAFLAASLKGKHVKIHVGAQTEAEFIEKQHRVTDARFAVVSAVNGGIIPGSGNSFVYASQNKPGIDSYEKGWNMFMEAIKSPYYQLGETSGVSRPSAIEDPWTGTDLRTGKTGDMLEVGVIDPLDVGLAVINTSVSIAEFFLRTNSMICI